ncbi:MAG: STAS domain-containing protein [Planctomycetes bacterium]|nr:STAS domain-containing protein [Planctomycetota bacterium]
MTTQLQRQFQVEEIGDVTVVRWDEQPHWPDSGDQLFKLVDEAGRRKLVLNFGNAESLSSTVLAKLMMLNKKLQTVGGVLILCNLSPHVREVFEVTRVNEFFGFHPGEAEALQALAAGNVK